MNAHLLYKDRNFNLQQPPPPNEANLKQDLELDLLLNAMSLDDRFVLDVARQVLINSEHELEVILYRQAILRDCLKNPAVIREIYQILIESIENKRKQWLGIFGRYPSSILYSAVEMLQMFMGLLRRLRTIADENAAKFESDGFKQLFAMIQQELDDAYFETVQEHLKALKFRNGVLISAVLGRGNEGTGYTLRKPAAKNLGWMRWAFSRGNSAYTFYIHERDDAGSRALSELKDRGINLVANAIAQSADHIENFFNNMRAELAFYIGCLNLYNQLNALGKPVTFPLPVAIGTCRHTFQGLYDVSLALTLQHKPVGNDLQADGKKLIFITGANQGGKSTFLRSLGTAQLMMQCGMFVGAESFSANVCGQIFTHYKRKEDAQMKSGKLDEELSRMNDIIQHIQPGDMLLFNESFAATNEREGSEIARQITSALVEKEIKVFFVTHLYEFAHSFHEKHLAYALFLRAERKADGGRTYKIMEGEPLQTSFGKDVYKTVFGSLPQS